MRNLLIGIITGFILSVAATTPSKAATPPFKQCSPSGYTCNILITLDRNGYLHVDADPSLNYYPPNHMDGGSLIGFQNDSRATVYSLSFNATPGDPREAAWICGPTYPPTLNAANVRIINIPERDNTSSPPYYYYSICIGGVCPLPPYRTSCDVAFSGGISKGGSTYFSLSDIAPNYPNYFQVTHKDVIPFVEFQETLEKDQTAAATVTLYPSPSPLPVTLSLMATTGTGSAVFTSTNSTTMTVTTSGTIQIRGIEPSSTAANIELSGTVSGEKRSRRNFTVTGATLSCTSPVTRGDSITCRVNNGPAAGASYAWKFTDANNNVVTANNNSAVWPGAMVTSGVVAVSIGGSIPLTPASVTVNNRANFEFIAVNPAQVMSNSLTCYDGTTHALPSPPIPDSEQGHSCADMTYAFTPALVADGGPNNGYQYVLNVADVFENQSTKFEYIVVSDLLNSGSAFYTSQCGDYSSSNSGGFIAGSQYQLNVFNHEQGSILSHWTEYKDAQNNNGNNIGSVLEAVIGAPSISPATYMQIVTTAGNAAMGRIAQAVRTEPCEGLTNYDSSQSCKYCGNINYDPYQSCGGSTPVPYCH